MFQFKRQYIQPFILNDHYNASLSQGSTQHNSKDKTKHMQKIFLTSQYENSQTIIVSSQI